MQRSYTFVYALFFDLTVAILIGLPQSKDWITEITNSPVAAVIAIVAIYFGLMANYKRFIKKTRFSKWECWVSAAGLAFVPGVLWLLFLAFLELTGADIDA